MKLIHPRTFFTAQFTYNPKHGEPTILWAVGSEYYDEPDPEDYIWVYNDQECEDGDAVVSFYNDGTEFGYLYLRAIFPDETECVINPDICLLKTDYDHPDR